MTRSVVEAGGFRSLIYHARALPGPRDAPLAIFIEGDGVPWRGGMEPSLDPTTGNPLALKLLAQTPAPAAYVARPCYQEMTGPRCTPERWTLERYSEEIVSSMTEAVRTAAARANARSVVLVGYSGGGVLAVLIAERLDNVSRRHHRRRESGYRRVDEASRLSAADWLTESCLEHGRASDGRRYIYMGRATRSCRPRRPPPISRASRTRSSKIVDDYDHVCCWVEQWPTAVAAIRQLASP